MIDNDILSEEDIKSLFMGLVRLVQNNTKKEMKLTSMNKGEVETKCQELEKENFRLNQLLKDYIEKMQELRARIVSGI